MLVLFPIAGKPLHARYQGPYIVEKKINELDYVIQTPDRRKSSQLLHINMMPAPMAEQSEAQSCSLADDCSSITVSCETGIESWSGQ